MLDEAVKEETKLERVVFFPDGKDPIHFEDVDVTFGNVMDNWEQIGEHKNFVGIPLRNRQGSISRYHFGSGIAR